MPPSRKQQRQQRRQRPYRSCATTQEAERVIVTGSNIPTAEEVGPNPVLNINRDLINKSGERNAEELLRNLPVANANGVPVSNNATGFTPGAAVPFHCAASTRARRSC